MTFIDALKETLANILLDELYNLTQKEYNDEKLTQEESKRYVEIFDILTKDSIEIPFAVNV